MDRYTLIFVADERSPVRRFQVPKSYAQRAVAVIAVLGFLFLLASWDYWRKRADNAELSGLRVEAAEQREQIEAFERTLESVKSDIARVRELERKVRIIANLPGAAAVGGDEVTELMPTGGAEGEGEPVMLPVGVPIDVDRTDVFGEGLEVPLSAVAPEQAEALALTSPGARYVWALDDLAGSMSGSATRRSESLELLLGELEDKGVKLASMPSIWPARGWLTSRYGARVSPFTGRSQKHAGIDIASRKGTPIIAPARGRVSYVGKKGPLGNTLMIDHGYGVRTVYGHTDKIDVSPGDEVERGQKIADIGNSGRSTGPHLHYVVEVNGKTRDPLDYIFD